MKLTEFLLARIAEDEAVALGSGVLGWVTYRDRNGTMQYTTAASRLHDNETWVSDAREVTGAASVQVVHDEARVLAECKAKRAIIESPLLYPFLDAKTAGPFTSAPSVAGLRILKALALPYADHPDYREEWL